MTFLKFWICEFYVVAFWLHLSCILSFLLIFIFWSVLIKFLLLKKKKSYKKFYTLWLIQAEMLKCLTTKRFLENSLINQGSGGNSTWDRAMTSSISKSSKSLGIIIVCVKTINIWKFNSPFLLILKFHHF